MGILRILEPMGVDTRMSQYKSKLINIAELAHTFCVQLSLQITTINTLKIMKVRKVISIIVMLCCVASVSAREKIKVEIAEDNYSLEAIVANINATFELNTHPYNEYDEKLTMYLFRDPMYCRAEKAVQKYFEDEDVEKHCNMIQLEEYMYDDLVETSSKANSTDILLRKAILYHLAGFTEHRALAYEIMARAYATKLDMTNLHQVLYCFQHSDINKSGEYNGKIEQLRNEFRDLTNSTDISLKTQGVWVSDMYTTEKKQGNFPYNIIKINNLASYAGIQSINLPKFDNIKLVPGVSVNKNFSAFQFSQGVAGNGYDSIGVGFISTRFGTQQFQQGMDVSSGFEQTRQFQSDMAGKIATSNYSTGGQIAATAATQVVGGLMNLALLSLSQSALYVSSMNLNIYPSVNDYKQMNSHILYYNYKANTNSYYQPRPTVDKDVTLLQWLPEDSVYFVNTANKKHNKIVSVTPLEDLDISEYEIIAKREKMIESIVLGTTIPTGVGITAGGLALLMSKNTKSNALIGGSVVMIMSGILGAIFPYVFYSNSKWYNADPYKDLNRKQLEKLKRKRQAELTLSPVVNPINNSIGVSANLTY